MGNLYRLASPLIRLVDPETAHGLAVRALRLGLVRAGIDSEDSILKTRVLGMDLPNPIGLAAGFDKNAQVVHAVQRLGFGFTEVGSVTPRPQKGNPRRRLFRLAADEAVINRMGFNNDGMEAVARRLRAYRCKWIDGRVGVNLGANKDTEDQATDYVAATRALAGLANYLVVNVSSPNTPGLRALQGRRQLSDLLAAVLEARQASGYEPPLLIKIAPDLTEEDKQDIAEVALASGLDGLIATNTTIERPAGLTGPGWEEAGGLSGRPLMAPSTRVLADMYRLTGGRLPLIGVGGVANGADAYAKIRAGASLVQLYTALVFQGPGLIGRIKTELAQCLRDDGFASVADAVGADHD